MKPTDIATAEEWKNIQSLFSSITGLTSVTFDLEANPVAPPDFKNSFCREFKATGYGAKMCKESHIALTEEVIATRRPVVGRCKAGLIKVVVPIFYDGEIIGVTGGCGVYKVDDELDTEKLVEMGKAAGLDEDRVVEIAATIKAIDDATIQKEINILQSKVDAIIARSK